MTIKILHAADIHIQLYKNKVPFDWQLNRFKLFFTKMLELEKSHDLVVLAGDILNSKPETDEVTLFLEYLNQVTKPIIVIPGNHEATKKGETFLEGFVRDKAVSNPLVQFFTKNSRINFQGYWIQMFPYTEVQTDNLENYLEKDILITHIRGEVPPHITAEYDFNKIKGYSLVLCGDLHFYHKYQNTNVFYPGSPLNVDYDRNENKKYGVLSHTYAKGFHTHTFIDLELPKLIRKKIKAGDNLAKDPINRVIYEVEGTLEDIQKVEKSDLLDKKIVDLPNSKSALDLKNKTLLEEVEIYLKHLKIDNISEYLTELNNLNITSADSTTTKVASNIKLLNMQWANMYSYGTNNNIDFTSNKITQINAINGTGKSAIMLILQEILSSKNMKGIKKGDIVNRYTKDKKWFANLNLEINNIPYLVKVTRNADASKVALFKNGVDISEHKIPDTYKLLLSLLNTTPEVLNQLIYQSSNSQLEFLKATDTNRKKFLVGLFLLERYLQIGEILKLKITQVEKNLSSLQGELKGVYDSLKDQINLGEKQNKIVVPSIDEILKQEIRDLEYDISNNNKLCLEIDKNNLLLQEQSSIKFEIDMANPDPEGLILKTINTKYNAVNTDVTILLQQITKDKKALVSLDTATHCPTCHQKIDNSHSVTMSETLKNSIDIAQQKINSLQNDLVTIGKERAILGKSIQDFIDNQLRIKRFEQLASTIDYKLTKTYPNINSIKEELNTKKQKLNLQTESQNEAIRFNGTVDILNAKIDMVITQNRNLLARQELLSYDIINIQSQLNRLTILRKAFSPTGIVAYKLENIIKEFEIEINNYLVEFSDGQFQINFRLEGEKLNIVVFNNGEESPIENVSEGEFSRIQTSTLLAIRKLLSKMGGININLLFLDEVMGVLDSAGRNNLIDILQNEEDTNTFIVAHNYSNPLVPQMNIVKENNIARIV